MDTSDEWIRKRSGIVTRHYASPDQATSDLAVPAAQRALEDAGVEASEIDYVVFATMTPDYYFPGAAPIFQRKLGLGTIPCLDIRQQCSGFLYGLQLADALVRSGASRNVLLIGAEVHGGFMPYKDWDVVLGRSKAKVSPEEFERNTLFWDRLVLFGDGAGAFVVSGDDSDERGIESVRAHADGKYADKLWVDGGGSAYRHYFEPRMYEDGSTVPIVKGRDVYRLAVTVMPDAVREILTAGGYGLDDLDLLVMHQANLRINEAVQERLGLPDERVYNNIQKYGNTTAATLPMAFHEARQERMLKPGALIFFVALGSGLTWGAALYRY